MQNFPKTHRYDEKRRENRGKPGIVDERDGKFVGGKVEQNCSSPMFAGFRPSANFFQTPRRTEKKSENWENVPQRALTSSIPKSSNMNTNLFLLKFHLAPSFPQKFPKKIFPLFRKNPVQFMEQKNFRKMLWNSKEKSIFRNFFRRSLEINFRT